MKRMIINLITCVVILCLLAGYQIFRQKQDIKLSSNDSFNLKLLKEVNKDNKKNYLISPYSIEIALNMLKSGADGDTYNQIDKVVGTRNINFLDSEDVKVANALFIKEKYKDFIIKDFSNNLVKNYSSEILYDEFVKPDVINNWVSDHTNKLIPTLLDKMDPHFVLCLANAVAIDVKWQDQFDANDTYEETFKNGNKEKDVEMMHQTYDTSDYKYFKTDNAKGIMLPYVEKNNVALEFVGILPNDDLNSYINNLNEEELKKIDNNAKEASDKLNIELSLPKFEYDYEIKNFITLLKNMGIKDVFDKDNANLTKMMTKEDMYKNGFDNLYVGEAIHKTKIKVAEKGTEAAAVTYFGVFETSGMISDQPKIIEIRFNKPFMYMIRDKHTQEVLFIGTVYEP